MRKTISVIALASILAFSAPVEASAECFTSVVDGNAKILISPVFDSHWFVCFQRDSAVNDGTGVVAVTVREKTLVRAGGIVEPLGNDARYLAENKFGIHEMDCGMFGVRASQELAAVSSAGENVPGNPTGKLMKMCSVD